MKCGKSSEKKKGSVFCFKMDAEILCFVMRRNKIPDRSEKELLLTSQKIFENCDRGGDVATTHVNI